MQSGTKRPASRGNRVGMALVALVVFVLITVLLMQSYVLKNKISAASASNDELRTQITQEQGRTEDLKTLPAYINSDEYIEKVAREKFGLVYKDEVIFRAAD